MQVEGGGEQANSSEGLTGGHPDGRRVLTPHTWTCWQTESSWLAARLTLSLGAAGSWAAATAGP